MARAIILSVLCLFIGIINAKQVIGVANADEAVEMGLEQGIQPQRAMRDPTQPLRWTKSSQSAATTVAYRPVLQSIICDEERCHAIVDGKLLKTGQSINGYKVHSITPQKVVLTRGGTVWNLELFSQIIQN